MFSCHKGIWRLWIFRMVLHVVYDINSFIIVNCWSPIYLTYFLRNIFHKTYQICKMKVHILQRRHFEIHSWHSDIWIYLALNNSELPPMMYSSSGLPVLPPLTSFLDRNWQHLEYDLTRHNICYLKSYLKTTKI